MNAKTITSAALEVLGEVGLDKLTMRLIATRLGVQVGGLYYYLPDKTALLRSMANEVCAHALAAFEALPASGGWPADPARLCSLVRDELHVRRDGARVLAAGPLSGSIDALALMERLIGLIEAGIGAPMAGAAADTLLAYVTGFVIQEQAEVTATTPYPLTPDELRDRFPRLSRGLGAEDDDTFRAGVTAILVGFAAASGVPVQLRRSTLC